MCALRRPLWKHLQNDDPVPTKIENAFQKNWVTHLAVNVRKVGSTSRSAIPDSVLWLRRVPGIDG